MNAFVDAPGPSGSPPPGSAGPAGPAGSAVSEAPGDPTGSLVPPGDTRAAVDVVVVTYSPGPTLSDFLTSLAAATSRPRSVVMADNGSVDGAPETAAAAGWATLLATGGNLGYGAAANRGAAAGSAPWLVVANPDVRWSPGSLDALLDAASRHPGAGALGPLVSTPSGELYPSARALPSLGRGVGHAVFGWVWPGNPWTREYRQERGAVVERATGWLSGSCLLLRRDAFEAVGGFDEGYFMFFEDLDLCERLGTAGWECVYVPEAAVEHVGGHSWRSDPTPMLRVHHESAWRYVSRRYTGARHAPLRLVLRAGLAARFQLSRVVRRVGEGAPPTRSLDAG